MNSAYRTAGTTCLLLCWSLCGATGDVDSHDLPNESPKKIYELVNGQWFDGEEFQSYILYSANGILTKKKPRGDIETLDLANHFVLPPFAEAHNHNLGSALYLNRDFTKQMIQRYLVDGIFYVKIPGNPARNAMSLRHEFVNR